MSDHTPTQPTMKRCSKGEACCHPDGPWLPATTEYFSPRGANGQLRANCKKCSAHAASIYYSENAEKCLESGRRWRKNNPDAVRENNYRFYWSNPEENREKTSRWRQGNPEKVRAQKLRYRKAHPDRTREQHKRWRQKCIVDNPNKIRGYQKRYAEKNLDKISEKNRRWRLANHEKVRGYSRARKAQKREAYGTHTSSDIERIYQKQEGKCLYCGCDLNMKFHVDHFIPLKRGGRNGPENLALACQPCNNRKSSTLPYDWAEWNGAVPVEWDGRLL